MDKIAVIRKIRVILFISDALAVYRHLKKGIFEML